MEEIFWEVHSDNPQEGPGCLESTKKAFEMLENLPDTPKILDVGCGPGRHTIDLANISNAQITALDNHKPYLKQLEERAKAEGLSDRIKTVFGDMFDMKFEYGSFDIIWIEGALYFIGVEKGLKGWKKFLRPEGYICFTELCWLKENPPEEVKGFFKEEYPQMARLFRAIAAAEKIHAIKHLRLLKIIRSTEENLQASFESETTVSENVYPAFIQQAETDGNKAAGISFSHARDAEEVHAKLYKKAIGHMLDESVTVYHVCDVCGYVVDGEAPDACPVCGAKKNRFFEVK